MENAAAAVKVGLSTLGISDHGPGHLFYGISMREISSMRKDIKEAKEAHPGLEILLGVEANIVNLSGNLDVSAEEQKLFDYVMAGYHYGAFGEQAIKSVGIFLGSCLYNLTARSSVRVRNHNTDMVLATLYSNSIKVLTHPGDKAPFDMIEIIKACEKTGTWMEINCPHAALSTEDIKTAADYDVGFIIGSDAHAAKDVGLPDRALDRVFRAGLGPERIVNLIWKP